MRHDHSHRLFIMHVDGYTTVIGCKRHSLIMCVRCCVHEATTLDAISFWTVKLREHHDGHCVCYNVAVTLQLVLNTVLWRSMLYFSIRYPGRECANNTIIDLYTKYIRTLSLFKNDMLLEMTYFILHVDIGSTLNQLPHYRQVTFSCCKQQRSHFLPL